ncbi:transporter, small conductance mechanosensitive ion channel MscS family protein [gut metagenome]|uniref:Transporter, small conductance mechanosensitive ion channel MscS family protein n=1 Tax=gut metagenome TaxID=749906 RepID=J9H566_9ZZZZ
MNTVNPEMNEVNQNLVHLLEQMGVHSGQLDWTQRSLLILGILVIAFVADYFCRHVVIPGVKKLTSKTQVTWDDYLFSDAVLDNVCHLIPPIVLYVLLPFAFPGEPNILSFILKLCWVYITAIGVRLICSFLTSLYSLSNENKRLRNHSLKGVYQMLKLMVISVGLIIIISTLIDKDPIHILTGLGASAAILMLVFKDTIMGLVAGVQLSANDMLRPGDWITMPKYQADGPVLEVTLTTVKVQNFDKTIITIPPYALVSDSFQNWRGMSDSGGRRVKRSLSIDMHSVGFCTDEQWSEWQDEPWMEGFERTGEREVNLCVFRHYLEHYLRHHPRIHPSFTLMVRQLQPTAQGLPLELYFFSAGSEWIPYERLQAEVFEHVLAVLPMFGLRVFQSPSGLDLQALVRS